MLVTAILQGIMRPVILHYHYFKNAGTSVDAMLSRNFPGGWLSAEFQGHTNHHEVGRWIAANPQACAFSSHTAELPLPVVDGVEILPVVFLRHPLDRVFSAYSFERHQQSDSLGAKLAKETDFAGYVRARLNMPHDRQTRNFQTFRLSRGGGDRALSEIDRALHTLDRLPFVGLVEDFRRSTMRMNGWLRESFPEFQAFEVRKNVTRPQELTLEERLDHIRREIGDELYAVLLEANQNDIRLHEAAKLKAVAQPAAVPG